MYLHGRGVEVSRDHAREWYRKAASQGYAKAAAALAALDSDRVVEKAGEPRVSTEPSRESPLETCVKQVQKQLPRDSFDAYVEGNIIKMFGTPESFFKFRKCMSMSGFPLVDK
jgi:TPR repeat protein